MSVSLIGCGGGDSSSGGAAVDTSKPLAGKDLSKASQLTGGWFALNEGDFVGLEFMKEGNKVLLNMSATNGVTADFSVLDGGRLSVVLQGGMTTVMKATLAGDQLELVIDRNVMFGGGTQRFRKLREGETLADAIKADREAKSKAYAERVAAMEAFFKQPGLVIAPAAAEPGAPSPIALDVKVAGGFINGKAWHDDKPPHQNAISGRLNSDDRTQTQQIQIDFGPRVAPLSATPDNGGGNITLGVTGDAKAMKVAGKVTYGDGRKTYELQLRSDPKLHGEIVKRFDAELVRLEGLKRPLLDLLRDYAVLRGQMQPMNAGGPAKPDTTELVLVKDPPSGQFRVEGEWVSGQNGRGESVVAGAAAIVIDANEKAWLKIVTPPSRVYMLTLADPTSGKLSGQWEPTGYNQGWGAQFEVVEAMDAAARDAKFAAQRKALASIGSDAVFIGLAHEGSGFGMDMPIPARLVLTVDAAGATTGKIEYPSMSTLMSVKGQIADTLRGPRLQLAFTAADSTPGDQIFFRSIQRGQWVLSPVDGDPSKYVAQFTGPPTRNTTFTRVTSETTAALRQKLAESLAKGARLYMSKFVGWQTPGVTPHVVEWTLDPAGGKLTGSTIGWDKPQLAIDFTGQLAEEDGWLVLRTMSVMPFGRRTAIGASKLWVAADSAGVVHLNGATRDLGFIEPGQPLPEFPAQLDRLVEYMPIATADAAKRADIDKSIASTKKFRDDAAAATAAKDQAAMEALRAKLAPYLPHVQAKGGAVITTDTAADMGALLTEVTLNDAKTAVSGKGVDLREFPFREFTFDGVIDGYGQLVITTSLSKTPYAFNKADDKGLTGRYMAMAPLSEADRAKFDARIALGKKLAAAEPKLLTVQTLEAAAAKTREANLGAVSLPGVAIYQNRKNDQVTAMFTAASNGRYRWTKEPVTLRLAEPVKGSALYIKGGGPTDNLTVIINGVHKATIPAVVQLGAAIVILPPDLEILDLRLEAGGTAQARGVVLLP